MQARHRRQGRGASALRFIEQRLHSIGPLRTVGSTVRELNRVNVGHRQQHSLKADRLPCGNNAGVRKDDEVTMGVLEYKYPHSPTVERKEYSKGIDEQRPLSSATACSSRPLIDPYDYHV